MGRKKYNTEEERKAAMKARNAAYYQKNKEELAAKKAAYYQKNKDEITARQAEYYQKNKEEISAKNAAYKAAHKEEISAKQAEWYQQNKNEVLVKQSEYRATPFGRAVKLVGAYRKADKKYDRGECTIDAQWMVDNVFSGQCCAYCGETDWNLLGCDRIDNSLPHTPENVVPCCTDCNKKKGTTFYDEFMRSIGKIV